MRHSESFTHNYRSLSRSFESNLSDSLQKHDFESIHRLRVCIKKIKAFLYLIQYVNHDFDADKSFHYYRKIFKHAAKVRDLQVQLLLLEKLEKELRIALPVQKRRIADKVNKEYKKFKKYCGEINLAFHGKVKKRVLQVVKKDFSLLKARAYPLMQLQRIARHIGQPDTGSNDLHKLRIMLKDYVYSIVLINDCLLKNKVIAMHIDELNTLQDAIGKWHDQVVMLRFSSDYKHSKRFSPEEIKAKRLLQIRLFKSTRKLAASLKNRLPALLSSFESIEAILRSV